ncbi:MAG: hypothetical protein ACE5IQ_14240 [Candidatus Methylomirabilales bacterium]
MSQLPKRTLILLAVTVAASAFLLFGLFFSSPTAPRPARKAATPPLVSGPVAPPPASKQSTAPAARPAPTPGRRLAAPPPHDQPWGERDPFAIEAKRLPKNPKARDQFSGFTITGVVWGSHGYQALVNGHVVRSGDQIDGARIVRITKEGVELEKNGEARFLPLNQKEFMR